LLQQRGARLFIHAERPPTGEGTGIKSMTETAQQEGVSSGDISGRGDEPALPSGRSIRAIVFDLDGTLYVSDEFAAEIKAAAASYLTGVLGTGLNEARRAMAETRERLKDRQEGAATLSRVCTLLGGSVKEMHAFFCEGLEPESFLTRDQRVIDLLERLQERFALYLYTNNSRGLSGRITRILGIEGCFAGMFTIDDDWRAKPDGEKLERILREIGMRPSETLFVGDRYDVDLQVPEEMGCPVYLSRSVAQFLMLEQLLNDDVE